MATSQGDPFYSAKRRLSRGKKHLDDLESACAAFINSNPYVRVVEKDEKTGGETHKIRLVRAFPDELSEITSDILENLRSVLDQAAFAAAVAGGNSAPEFAYFPFSNSFENLENRAKGLCKDIPRDVTALFCSFQPYKGGNDVLWALNNIRGSNFHALLVPLGAASIAVTFDRLFIEAPKHGTVAFNPPLWRPGTWDDEKNEMVVARVDPGGTLDYDFKLMPQVVFGDVPVFAGQPVLATLYHLVGEVERILVGAERECRRLGLIN